MIAPTSFFSDYGCHVRILEQARGIKGRGYQVTLCTYHRGRDLPELTIRRTPAIPWRCGAEVGSSWHKLILDIFLFWLALYTACYERPTLIHAFLHEGALIGIIVGRLLRIPVIFDFQGSLTSEMVDHAFLSPHSLFFRPLLWLERWLDHQPAIILANSHHSAGLLWRKFGVSPARIRVVPDCVDTERFRPPLVGYPGRRQTSSPTSSGRIMEAGPPTFLSRHISGEAGLPSSSIRQSFGIPTDALVLVYLGLLAPYQGIDLMLRAMQLFPPSLKVHLLLMGFPNVRRYEQMAVRLKVADRVTFTGRVPYEEAPRMLAMGDIALAPKISATEGSGKLLNYMAMGLPTVAFDTPVSREYLGDAGVFAPAGDWRKLAECIAYLASHPAERARRGGQLRDRAVAHFRPEDIARRIEATYQTVCKVDDIHAIMSPTTMACTLTPAAIVDEVAGRNDLA